MSAPEEQQQQQQQENSVVDTSSNTVTTTIVEPKPVDGPSNDAQLAEKDLQNKNRSNSRSRSASTRSNDGSQSGSDSDLGDALEALDKAGEKGQVTTDGDDAANRVTRANSVFAIGFPKDVTEEEVKKFFEEKCGSVLRAQIRSGRSGDQKVYAFVFFGNSASKDAAVALNGCEFARDYKIDIEERDSTAPRRGGRSPPRRGGRSPRRGGRSGRSPRRGGRSPPRRGGDRLPPSLAGVSDRDRCYNCGGVGHISRDCPSRGGNMRPVGGRSPPRRTSSRYDDDRRRGGDDMMRRGRSPPRRGPEDDRRCFNCGRPGHISARCPERDGRRVRSPDRGMPPPPPGAYGGSRYGDPLPPRHAAPPPPPRGYGAPPPPDRDSGRRGFGDRGGVSDRERRLDEYERRRELERRDDDRRRM